MPERGQLARLDAGDEPLTDAEYAAMAEAREAAIARARPPHGITEARSSLPYGEGYITITKLQYRP